jgi:DNA modification methylase
VADRTIPITCDPDGRLKRMPLSELTPFQGNLKDLPDEQYAKLKASIDDEGFMAPVFVWQGKILDGHQRTAVLQREGWQVEGGKVPVVEIQADSEQDAARKLLKLTSAYGKPQAAGVFEFMQAHDLGLDDFADVDLPDFDTDALSGLFGEDDEPEPTDDTPEPPVSPVSRVGDLWCMGGHRVLCGDSTSEAATVVACGGTAPGCMWTDPPYGVNYTGKTKAALNISNDDPEGLPALLAGAFAAASAVLSEGAAVYIAHPPGALSLEFLLAFRAAGWRLHETLVWVKDSLVLGHSDYHYKHEPILFGYTPGGGRRGRGGTGWYGDNSQVSTLCFDRPKRSEDHPTSKPVALVASMLRNSSAPGSGVLDLFLGSGTTLVACEQLGRICLGMEIDPAYVDVSVTRWQEYTNQEAILDGDGRTFAEIKKERLSGEDMAQAAA